jgi:lactoylglutathione lyase
MNLSTRPFTILGLQQIAIGSTNPKQMSQLWHDIFGLPKIGTYTSISENVSEDILQLGPSTRKISIPLNIDSIEGNSHGDWGISGLEDTEELGKDVVLGQAQINVPFVEVDLMCPLDESKSPKVHIPPLNHIGLWVDDLKSSVTWMKDNGMLKIFIKMYNDHMSNWNIFP